MPGAPSLGRGGAPPPRPGPPPPPPPAGAHAGSAELGSLPLHQPSAGPPPPTGEEVCGGAAPRVRLWPRPRSCGWRRPCLRRSDGRAIEGLEFAEALAMRRVGRRGVGRRPWHAVGRQPPRQAWPRRSRSRERTARRDAGGEIAGPASCAATGPTAEPPAESCAGAVSARVSPWRPELPSREYRSHVKVPQLFSSPVGGGGPCAAWWRRNAGSAELASFPLHRVPRPPSPYG